MVISGVVEGKFTENQVLFATSKYHHAERLTADQNGYTNSLSSIVHQDKDTTLLVGLNNSNHS